MEKPGYNIFLIGFMGAGKSTIARQLHMKYGLELTEMDQVIEEREKLKISGIFERYGEEYFRRKETELLLEFQRRKNLVVSCGGGAPLRDCNVEAMKRSGKIVFLTADPETVFERVKNSHDRPVIEKNKNVPFIAALMEQRRGKYEKAADFSVSTDNREPEEICLEIMRRISEEKFVREE